MTASPSAKVEGIYRTNPTICRELRGEPGEMNIAGDYPGHLGN